MGRVHRIRRARCRTVCERARIATKRSRVLRQLAMRFHVLQSCDKPNQWHQHVRNMRADGVPRRRLQSGGSAFVSSEGSRCIATEAEGTPCSSPLACATGQSCIEGLCAKTRGDGEACTSATDCDPQQELTCVDKIRRKPSIVDIGATCSIAA